MWTQQIFRGSHCTISSRRPCLKLEFSESGFGNSYALSVRVHPEFTTSSMSF